MTDLTPVSSLDNVVQHETADLVLAGPGGPLNQQAQQLLNRTKYLDDARIDHAASIAALQSFDTDLGNSSDLLKGVSKVGGAGRVVDSLTALRALPKTGSPIAFMRGAGEGIFKVDLADTTSADDGGIIIVATDGGRWKRQFKNNGNGLPVSWFGATEGADSTQAFIKAATFLLKQTFPGGTIIVDGSYRINAGQINFWNILAAEQGITPADPFLPNGELVRGTYIGLLGFGYEYSKIRVIGSGDGFVWGNFTNISSKRAMSGQVHGIDFRGDGAIGHTSQVIIAGAQGFSTTTTALAGTTNTATRCLVFQEIVPVGVVTGCRFRHFQEACHQTYGFGFVADYNDIQYCNIGYFFDAGVTTWEVRSGNEVEVCAVGIFSKNTSNGKIGAAVIEANLAGCDVLIWVSKYLDMFGTWFEGSPQNVVMRGDLTAPSLPNSSITIRDAIGLNIHSNGGLIDFRAIGCAMNAAGEFLALNSGEQFRNVVYEKCTLNEGPFDMSSITLDGLSTFDDIQVIGPTISGATADYPARPPLLKKGITTTASATAVKAFSLTVLNEDTTARIEVIGYKKSTLAADMQMQTQRYVGVIRRFTGAATVVSFSTTESITTNHTSTGTNVPVTVATPSVVLTGGVGATQTAEIRFPTGTAVSGLADNFWEVRIDNESGAISFE